MSNNDINSMELLGLNEAAIKLKLSPSEFSLPAIYGASKTVAVVGRAKIGKSFVVSMFADKAILYRNIFSGGGDDKTVCPVRNIFIDTTDEFIPFIEFSTDFHNVFKDIAEYEDLCAESEAANGVRMLFDDNEKLPKVVERIENLVKKIYCIEKCYAKNNPCKTTKRSMNLINVYSKPSDFARKIMKQTGLKRIEIIDTPGVSGNIEFAKISKADLYVFVVNDANQDEAETLGRIVKEVKQYIATSSACFLYRSNGYIATKDKFEKEQQKAVESMRRFERHFESLGGSIISTDMDVLYPAKSCLCFPPMDSEELSLPEELFCEKFKEKLIYAFNDDKERFLKEEFDNFSLNNKQMVLEYIKIVLQRIPSHKHCEANSNYLPNFINEGHDRVKSNDSKRVVSKVEEAYLIEKELLYNYFHSYTVENCPEIWRQHKHLRQ